MGVNRKSPEAYRREYYPSGPWVGGRRPPEHEPTPRQKEPTTSLPPGDPDPSNYKVLKAREVGPFLILKINYPDCTNYEGDKVLVYRNVTLLDLVNQRIIDPHFFEDEKVKSPVARFVPTEEGWNMAVKLAETLQEN